MSEKGNVITRNQLVFLLIGFTLGPEFLRLPNEVVAIAKQDSWISAIIALAYPVYVIILSSVIIKHNPKDNIIALNKKFFGKLIGTALNFLFLQQFFLYSITIVVEFIRVTRVYIVAFLLPPRIALTCLMLSTYIAYKGFKTLGRVNEFFSYVMIIVILFSFSSLKYGTILNVQPVFGTGMEKIFLASFKTLYYYTGFEAILLYHTYVESRKNILQDGLKSVFIAGVIWVWTVFSAIYYLGVEVIPKTAWSFIWTYESVNIAIINNFRYIFMFAWILVSFRIIANYQFSTAFIISHYVKIKSKTLCLILAPIFFTAVLQLLKGYYKELILKYFTPASVCFNITLITTLAILSVYKSKAGKNSKSGEEYK